MFQGWATLKYRSFGIEKWAKPGEPEVERHGGHSMGTWRMWLCQQAGMDIYIYTVTTFEYVEGGPDREAPEVV